MADKEAIVGLRMVLSGSGGPGDARWGCCSPTAVYGIRAPAPFARHPGSFFQYGHAMLPADSGLKRQVQHPSVRHGRRENIFELLDTPLDITSRRRIPLRISKGAAVEFDHVWFAYKDEDWVLRDVKFRIEPGETIAVVGHTGAGKTTFIESADALLRYSARVDTDRRAWIFANSRWRILRRHFSMVLQDPYLFTGTVGVQYSIGSEWIWIRSGRKSCGRPGKSASISCSSLSEGFAEPVRERGNGFSTGQKQLISFARALAHNPRYLILDEATSSVDTETEFRVREALEPDGGRPDVAGDCAPALHHPARRRAFS